MIPNYVYLFKYSYVFLAGLELGFFSGVYSACIGHTKSFENAKELVGISGIFIGLGEVLGMLYFYLCRIEIVSQIILLRYD